MNVSQGTREKAFYLDRPGLAKAYGQLRRLFLRTTISLLPSLAPFLTSLASLIVGGSKETIKLWPSREPEEVTPVWKDGGFLEAMRNMASLETLFVVMPGHDYAAEGTDEEEMVDEDEEDEGEEDEEYLRVKQWREEQKARFIPDYETVFDQRPTLLNLIFLRIDRGSDRKFSPLCYQHEGGPGGPITPNDDVLRRVMDKPYFLQGWLGIVKDCDDILHYLPSQVVQSTCVHILMSTIYFQPWW